MNKQPSVLYRAWRRVRRIPGEVSDALERVTPVRIPILMYHKIGPKAHTEWWVATAEFAAQVRALKAYGYEPLSLSELMDCRAGLRAIPQKPVMLTFDDGYRDILTEVLPVLQRPETAFKITVFVPTAHVGQDNRWDTGVDFSREPLAPHLSWDEIRRVADSGLVDFQSHSDTHPRLPDLGDADIERELAGSRSKLEHELGRPVHFISYPFSAGAHFPHVHDLVRRTGYRGAVGVDETIETDCRDRWNFRRVTILADTSLTYNAAKPGTFFFGPALLDDSNAPAVDACDVRMITRRTSDDSAAIVISATLKKPASRVQPVLEIQERRDSRTTETCCPLIDGVADFSAGRVQFETRVQVAPAAQVRLVLRDEHDAVRAFASDWSVLG